MKHALKDMTVAEFRDRLSPETVILLPFGSQEEQGPHAPMGDYAIADAVAVKSAELSGAIAAPCLPFGYAEFFRGFPGGIQLRAPTFTALVEDILVSFLDHGIERLIVLNGHTTNTTLIDQVQRKLRRERGVAVASIDLWRSIPAELWNELYGTEAANARGHGADPLTSLGLYLYPDKMRTDLMRPSVPSPAFGLPGSSTAGVRFEGMQVNLPLNADEVNADGMLGGNAGLASAEAGRRIFEHVTGTVARFVEHMRLCDPRRPFAAEASGARG
ncbi:creatininase family protein [Nitratireductor indicus]|uniref:creatininase family protein n=1 Tax=Nitratireductor indicus TaxID=721133 RepID=UPI0028769F89|nr:creatininase family protein [Nitratireductor indicus]MDS1138132.1 creatininase family protein [Nitratireductor indicus]